MSSFHERFLSRLPASVLRAVARRMGIEAADDLDPDELAAELGRIPADSAVSLGQTLRRFMGRLPAGLLHVREPTPRPAVAPDGDGAPAGPADAAAGEDPLRFDTVSMADLLLRQGYVDRARDTLVRILARDPEHADARARLERLQDPPQPAAPSARPAPPPPSGDRPLEAAHPARADDRRVRPLIDRPAEPDGLLDLEELPAGYSRVYAGLLPVDASTLYAYWEVTAQAVDAVRRKLGDPAAPLSLRLISHYPGAPAGGELREVAVEEAVGERLFGELQPGANHRLAVGVRGRGGAFEPVCHTSIASTPVAHPSGDTREAWLEVIPAGETPGPVAEPIRVVPRDAPPPEFLPRPRLRRPAALSVPQFDAAQRVLARMHEALRAVWPNVPLPSSGGPTPASGLPTSPGMRS